MPRAEQKPKSVKTNTWTSEEALRLDQTGLIHHSESGDRRRPGTPWTGRQFIVVFPTMHSANTYTICNVSHSRSTIKSNILQTGVSSSEQSSVLNADYFAVGSGCALFSFVFMVMKSLLFYFQGTSALSSCPSRGLNMSTEGLLTLDSLGF